MKKRSSINTRTLLIAAILVIVNVMAFSLYFRIDFTKDKRYTLSQATLDILHDLKKPVTITAYYTENSTPAVMNAREELKDILTEYAARSGNKVVYNFVNPNKSDSLEKIAVKNGISPFPLQVREKDEMKTIKIYLGAIIKEGDKTDILPIIDPNHSLEFVISNSIKKLSVDKKPVVALIQGDKEASLADLPQLNEALSAMYAFQEYKLTDSVIPADFKTIAIVDPKDTITPGQLKRLDEFVARGGRVLIAYSGIQGDLQTVSGKAISTGLERWLVEKNIVIEPKFVIDAHCGSITVREREGQFDFANNVPFPYLPLIRNFANHPITKQLSQVLLPFTSDIKYTGDTNKVKYVPLAFTSDKTGLVTPPVTLDANHQWQPGEFPLSNVCVAAAFSGIDGNKDSRFVVIANSIFVTNGQGQQAQKQEQDNIDFFVNSIDWLTDDTGLIGLRSKEVKPVPLADVSDSKKLFLKYFNFLFPLLLVVFYGIFRFQMRRRTRNKRMAETYE